MRHPDTQAAAEMKHRLKLLLGEATSNKIVAGTFHSICVRCACDDQATELTPQSCVGTAT